MSIEERAFIAAETVLADCMARRGIKQEFAACDAEVIEEILEAWTKTIAEVFSRPEPGECEPA